MKLKKAVHPLDGGYLTPLDVYDDDGEFVENLGDQLTIVWKGKIYSTAYRTKESVISHGMSPEEKEEGWRKLHEASTPWTIEDFERHPEAANTARQAWAEKMGRCARCNRQLRAAPQMGLGPECIKYLPEVIAYYEIGK